MQILTTKLVLTLAVLWYLGASAIKTPSSVPFVFENYLTTEHRIVSVNRSLPMVRNDRYLDYYKAYGLRYQPIGKIRFPEQEFDGLSEQSAEEISNSLTFNDNFSLVPPKLNKFNSGLDVIKTSRVERALQFIVGRVKKLMELSLNLKSGELFEAPSSGRFLNLFNVIKFENAPCTTKSQPLRQMNGVCFQRDECTQLGGTPIDSCANGFGVCCAFQAGCNSVIRESVTYFESPGFPSAYRQQVDCTTIVLLQHGVKQILLEFLFFEMLPPQNGTCTKDQFKIQIPGLLSTRYPVLCGINTGQHMYLDVEGIIDMKIQLSALSTSSDARGFSVKITQIRGGQPNQAPADCLQYFTSPNGNIKTFNYDNVSEIVEQKNAEYFNNLNYAFCIKRQRGFCSITYSNEVNNLENTFQLINVDEDGESVIPPNQAGAEIFNCAQDFIAINSIRLCGEKLNDGSGIEDFTQNAQITDKSLGPILIPFRSDGRIVGRGFSLFYQQKPCEI